MAFNPSAGTKMPGSMGQTEEEIARAVEAEVAAEIEAQISPLQTAIGEQQAGETTAVQKLGELYDTIQPFATNAAANLRSNFDTSIGFEKGVFDASQAQIAGVRQQAGAAAQALSQQLGVPIPISLFDMGALTEQGLGLAEGAGALLTHQGMRDAALAEAEAFSGRVFPLMRKEQETDTRNYFRTQITSLQKEIASIRKMKPGLINERTRQRLLEERTYQLERVQAQRDWEVSKFSANLESSKLKEAKAARIAADKLTKRAQDLQAKAAAAGEVTTRRGQTLDSQARAATLKAQKAQAAASNKEYEAKRSDAIQSNITSAIQAYITGGSAKLKTVQKDPATGSYQETTRDMPTGEGAITNPNLLLEAVRSAVPGAREMPEYLRKQIISALNAHNIPVPKNWVEGQAAGKPTEKTFGSAAPTRKTMQSWDFNRLETWAKRNYGFKGGYPKSVQGQSPSAQRKRKSWLINWVARTEVDLGGTATYGPR